MISEKNVKIAYLELTKINLRKSFKSVKSPKNTVIISSAKLTQTFKTIFSVSVKESFKTKTFQNLFKKHYSI